MSRWNGWYANVVQRKIVLVGISRRGDVPLANGATPLTWQRLKSYHIVMEGLIEMTTILAVHKVFDAICRNKGFLDISKVTFATSTNQLDLHRNSI
jgi:hypothetical protein